MLQPPRLRDFDVDAVRRMPAAEPSRVPCVRMISRLVIFAMLVASSARAQSGTVDGVVFDSLNHRPLAGALVQIVASPPATDAYSATSDSLGRFRFEQVRAGQYVAGFLHPLLDTLGITPPYRAVGVEADGTAHIALAVPSAARLTAAICAPKAASRADSAARTAGMLVGHVSDATGGRPVQGSLVAAVWSEMVLDARGVRSESRQLHARTNDDGWFAMCGLEAGDYRLRAELGKRATGFVDVTVRENDIQRAMFVLGADSDSSTQLPGHRGSAALAGVVRNGAGRPVEGAQVVVEGDSAIATTDASGSFTLTGLPDGTRTAEARALGYAPTRVTVEPARGETRTVAIVMSKTVKALDAVTVYGKPTGRFRDLSGFVERQHRGFGRFVTRADIERTSPNTVCDLLRRVVGLQVTEGGMSGCVVSMRGASSLVPTSGAGGACEPAVYLDNSRYGGSIGQLAQEMSPQDIMGIEVYSTATEPPQFPGACGTIVVWTRT